MKTNSKIVRLLIVIFIFFILGVIFKFTVRPWLLTWGASANEVELVLPGDSILANPSYIATRAITIDVKPREIYPWLIQMGYGKAGFYGFDWFNNGFKSSSVDLMPKYQNIKLGDTIPNIFGLDFQVVDFAKDTFIVWKDLKDNTESTWTWMLVPVGKRETRLISRLKVNYNVLSPKILMNLGFEITDLPITRKTLNGIKQRAEGEIRSGSYDLAEALFLFIPFAAFIIFFLRIFKKEKWWEPLTMSGFMLAIFLVIFYVTLPVWALVIASFIVLLTLIGTAAETAAVKKHQEENTMR